MKKSEKRQRNDFIRARVTAAEKVRFLARCERSGLSTGDYIRSKCLDEKPLRAVRQTKVDLRLIEKLSHQLARYGNNLNQIAWKLNRSESINQGDVQFLQAIQGMIKSMRAMLRQALGYDSQR